MLTAVKRNTNGTNLTRVSLKGILGISFLAALTYAPFINAAQRVVVNEAQIQVEDQTQRTQQNALKKALRQVFVKMSGSTSVLDNAGVRAALSSPQSLLRSYRFAFDKGRTYYVAEFDQAKLNELLQREMLPLWGDRRPETIVWLAQEDENETRVILDESLNTELQHTLKQTAKERGVPLSLPLMDLTDNVNISTYDVWGRFVEPLRKASTRYSVDNIIGARVYRNDASAIPDLPENVVPSGTVESLDSVLDEEAQFRAQTDGQSFDERNPRVDNTDAQRTFSDNVESGAMNNGVDAQLNDGYDETNQNLNNADGTSAKELAQEESTTMPFTMNEFANYAKRADEG
ncbi:MAG: DUF2066 domain-containing protein, partial [Alteromonas sp.]